MEKAESFPLPTYEDVIHKVDEGVPLSRIEQFVYENETAGSDEVPWREGLTAALEEAFQLGQLAKPQSKAKKRQGRATTQESDRSHAGKAIVRMDDDELEVMDWNEISRRGLLVRINQEIMHPLGLAVFRDSETGTSGGALISPDGVWSYSEASEK